VVERVPATMPKIPECFVEVFVAFKGGWQVNKGGGANHKVRLKEELQQFFGGERRRKGRNAGAFFGGKREAPRWEKFKIGPKNWDSKKKGVSIFPGRKRHTKGGKREKKKIFGILRRPTKKERSPIRRIPTPLQDFDGELFEKNEIGERRKSNWKPKRGRMASFQRERGAQKKKGLIPCEGKERSCGGRKGGP